MEMNDAVVEAALIEQFELRADAVRQGAFAATNHDRAQEEMALIDKAGADRLAGEPGGQEERALGQFTEGPS